MSLDYYCELFSVNDALRGIEPTTFRLCWSHDPKVVEFLEKPKVLGLIPTGYFVDMLVIHKFVIHMNQLVHPNVHVGFKLQVGYS